MWPGGLVILPALVICYTTQQKHMHVASYNHAI